MAPSAIFFLFATSRWRISVCLIWPCQRQRGIWPDQIMFHKRSHLWRVDNGRNDLLHLPSYLNFFFKEIPELRLDPQSFFSLTTFLSLGFRPYFCVLLVKWLTNRCKTRLQKLFNWPTLWAKLRVNWISVIWHEWKRYMLEFRLFRSFRSMSLNLCTSSRYSIYKHTIFFSFFLYTYMSDIWKMQNIDSCQSI